MDQHAQLQNLLLFDPTVNLIPHPLLVIFKFMCKYGKTVGLSPSTQLLGTNDTGSERQTTGQTVGSYPHAAFRNHSYPDFPASGDQEHHFRTRRYP